MRRIGLLLLAVLVVLPTTAIAAGADGFLSAADDRAELVNDAHQRAHEHKKNRPVLSTAAIPDERLSDVACTDGTAGPFPCDGIDLLSFVPYDEFVGPELTAFPGLSDVWGWTDSETGDEYVILGASNGVEFFRVTDPTDPVHLGSLENTAAAQLIWHDTKVVDDHAFIVSESNPHGMRIFDLTRLRDVEEPQTWIEDMRYPLTVAAHNVEVNTDTGFAYIVGGNAGLVVPDVCSSGLHMVDINDPMMPTFEGCWEGDSYIHDTQCEIYTGPDERYHERELCFNSNEDSLSIVDVTDKSNPELVGRTGYPHVAYTHQGWLTDDQGHFILGDELDEQNRPEVEQTRNVLFDVTDLENPTMVGEHFFDTRSITHNIYTKGPLAYHSNYTTGLRVTDTSPIAEGRLDEVAFFDTLPGRDDPTFNGTWSNYPYFESGTIAVSGIDEGLFLVRLQDDVAEEFNQHAPGLQHRPEGVPPRGPRS